MSDLRRLNQRMVPGGKGSQSASYWGMNPQPDQGHNLPYLKDRLNQRWDQLSEQASKLDGIGSDIYNPQQKDYSDHWDKGLGPSMEASPPDLRSLSLDPFMDLITPMGTIIGKGAKYFDVKGEDGLSLLDRAKALLEEGYSPKQVTKETGYFKDYAGNWKSQLSNAEAKYDKYMLSAFDTWRPGKRVARRQLGNVYKMSELYDNYPRIARDTDVLYTDKVKYAAMAFDPQTGKKTIKINPQGLRAKARKDGRDPHELLMATMAHEIDHVIQTVDNLPSGSNKKWILNKINSVPEMENRLSILKRGMANNSWSPETKKRMLKQIANQEKEIAFFSRFKEGDEGLIYQQTLGEADAFWTGAMHRDPEVATKLPLHYDTPQGRQLLDIDPNTGRVDWSDFDPKDSLKTSAYHDQTMGILDSTVDDTIINKPVDKVQLLKRQLMEANPDRMLDDTLKNSKMGKEEEAWVKAFIKDVWDELAPEDKTSTLAKQYIDTARIGYKWEKGYK